MGKKKGGRGGGRRHFVTSAEDLEKRNENQAAMQKARALRRQESDDESEVEEESEESRAMKMEAMRKEVVEVERKVKGPAVIETANPNAGDRNKFRKAKDMKDGPQPELTRREREEIEKQRAADHYRKLHAEGKTDEYKADMERLAEARKRREEEAAAASAAKAEEAAVDQISKKKKRAEEAESSDDDDKLDARTIKAMKPAQLKEALKKRGLSTQGQKKQLLERLLAAI